MPKVPPADLGSDYYLVIGMKEDPAADRADMEEMPPDIWASLLTYVVQANSEEEALAKLAPIKAPGTVRAIVIVAPIFPFE